MYTRHQNTYCTSMVVIRMSTTGSPKMPTSMISGVKGLCFENRVCIYDRRVCKDREAEALVQGRFVGARPIASVPESLQFHFLEGTPHCFSSFIVGDDLD